MEGIQEKSLLVGGVRPKEISKHEKTDHWKGKRKKDEHTPRLRKKSYRKK